jgi:endonuclease-8
MPEGPTIIIAREEMQQLVGKEITAASGTAKIDHDRLIGKRIMELKSWGKHFLMCFDGFTIKVHFLMFGTWYINSSKDRVPKLTLQFGHEELNLYACAVKLLEEPLDELYDWSADIMGDKWDAGKAARQLKKMPDTLVTDALLDQTIFSGLGNIIKNEVLYRIKVHPESKVGSLPPKKVKEMITEVRAYSFEFLQWRKEGTLRKHWLANKQKTCSRDGRPFTKAHLGETNRRTFFCELCQIKYG